MAFENADFITHQNYLKFMVSETNNLQLKINRKLTEKISTTEKLDKKLRLFNLTWENLKAEFEIIKIYPEYASVCLSWLPVKTYYLIFNLSLILFYLKDSNIEAFNYTHSHIHEQLKNQLKSNDLEFSNPVFNQVVSFRETVSWPKYKNENIKQFDNTEPTKLKHLIIRKLFHYSKDDFKRIKKIKRMTVEDTKIFNDKTMNLAEFFYWYRIKANYRDMEFIQRELGDQFLVEYYNNYLKLTLNYIQCLKKTINNLSVTRLGKEII